MKKLLLCCFLSCSLSSAYCQSSAIQQLLLNVEKLRQFKQILADMKKGYQILSKGYGTVKDLSKGNFHLHEVFLQSLNEVSPEVKKYHRVTAIIQGQVQLLHLIHSSLNSLNKEDLLEGNERHYLQQVFERMLKKSYQNVEDLLQILQPGQLQMNDEERLREIDLLDERMTDQFTFMKRFISTIQWNLQMKKKELSNLQQFQRNY